MFDSFAAHKHAYSQPNYQTHLESFPMWNCDCFTSNKTGLRDRKPLPTSKFQPKVIRNFNPNYQINLDPNACQISHQMWIHYLVGVSYFAKFCKNRLITVWEMLINLLKSPIPQWWGQGKVILNPYLGLTARQKERSQLLPSWQR